MLHLYMRLLCKQHCCCAMPPQLFQGQESNFELFQLIFFTFPPIQMLIFDFEVETCIEIAACNSDMNKSHCGSVSVFNLVNRMHRSFSGSY